MLKIRKTQMDSLSEAMLKQFEDHMDHPSAISLPRQTHDMPEPELRATIHAGDRERGEIRHYE